VEDADSAEWITGRLEQRAGAPVAVRAARRDPLLQPLGWLAAAVLALAIALLVFGPAAHWLAQHDVVSARGPLVRAAGLAARGQLLILCAGLFAAGSLLGLAESAAARPTLTLLLPWQVTRRYSNAVEHLGSDQLDVRTSGIHALGRVARRDPGRNQPAVIEVLTAFIRERSHQQGSAEPGRAIRSDVQAALTVIGRRDQQLDTRPVDLTGADLTYVHFARAHLAGAQLKNAALRHTVLTDAKLDGADLHGADLIGADLTGADLHGADLAFADLYDATLAGASFVCARLHHVRLARADLTGADLTGADLTGADLTGADLTGADLTGANFYDAHLTGARWPRDAAIPDGWTARRRRGLAEGGGQ
jgi:Pentapeptide repeats (8 copies)